MVTTEEEDSTKVKEKEEAKHSTEAVSGMAPVVVPCSVGGCQYETPEAELELAAQFLRIHADSAHVGHGGNVQQQVRPEKVRRPQLVVKEGFVTEEAFGYFEHAWTEYKTLAAVTTAVKQHLSSCLGEEVSSVNTNLCHVCVSL